MRPESNSCAPGRIRLKFTYPDRTLQSRRSGRNPARFGQTSPNMGMKSPQSCPSLPKIGRNRARISRCHRTQAEIAAEVAQLAEIWSDLLQNRPRSRKPTDFAPNVDRHANPDNLSRRRPKPRGCKSDPAGNLVAAANAKSGPSPVKPQTNPPSERATFR